MISKVLFVFIVNSGHSFHFAGQTEATLQCWGGYYCPVGLSEPNPVQYLCPQGLHCPNGSEIYKVGNGVVTTAVTCEVPVSSGPVLP